ncbi:MAG: hypothetical protein WDM76_09220 [Limisphaerales bacterium]
MIQYKDALDAPTWETLQTETGDGLEHVVEVPVSIRAPAILSNIGLLKKDGCENTMARQPFAGLNREHISHKLEAGLIRIFH